MQTGWRPSIPEGLRAEWAACQLRVLPRLGDRTSGTAVLPFRSRSPKVRRTRAQRRDREGPIRLDRQSIAGADVPSSRRPPVCVSGSKRPPLPPNGSPARNTDFRRVVSLVAALAVGFFLPSLPLASVPFALWPPFLVAATLAGAILAGSLFITPRSTLLLIGIAVLDAFVVGWLGWLFSGYYHQLGLVFMLVVDCPRRASTGCARR